jgi:chromate reductase, NAD(P)H dehydrogenase (quinone)
MARVSVLIGSLRRESINRKFAHALGKLAEGKLTFDYPSLDLPLYNEDLWADPSDGVLALKESVDAADAVLFVSPEYNRAFTPAIKNAIDWGSRPRGKSSWPGKPAGIVGASPGKLGTASSQALLRSVVTHVGMILMGQPEVYLQYSDGLVSEDHLITSEATAKFLNTYLDAFAAHIARVS